MGNITVMGSFIVDFAFLGEQLPEPGQTLLSKFTMGPGGKGSNQLVAAKLAGADVKFITALGNDMLAKVATDFYKKIGMSKEDLFIYWARDSHTGVASIAVEITGGQNQIMVAPGACEKITPGIVHGVKDFLRSKIFLTQFECNLEATQAAIIWANDMGAKVILNPAPAPNKNFDMARVLPCVDTIVPNETEASFITGVPLEEPEFHKKAAAKLSEKVDTVIITLGSQGVYCPSVSENILPSFQVEAVDTTGAGDAFCGCLAAALSEDKSLADAIRFAQAGAAISVTRHGTAPAMPRREEIENFLKNR